jgi:hypothetical protein
VRRLGVVPLGLCGVESAQLATGVVDGELPVDGGALRVAGALPGGNLSDEGVPVADASVEALAGEDAQFDLSEPMLLHLL